jgi:murein DD-endopeptidase MepM/ murein hydrolase activator NlpD
MPTVLVRAAVAAPLALLTATLPGAVPVETVKTLRVQSLPVQSLPAVPERATVTELAAAASVGPGTPVSEVLPVHDPSGSYVAPVPGVVVHPFELPAEEWLAGHRGVDLAARVDDAVAAPGPGTVTFSGQVGGKRIVVVTHPDGLRSTLEPVVGTVERGSAVASGTVVGKLTAAPETAANPGHCTPDDCLHWGVRRGDTYLDPLGLLGAAPPIVLLPLSP